MRILKTVLLLLALACSARAQMYQGRQLVAARLLAGADGIVPGESITIGLELEAEPGWHTYWQYSGDAGFPTKIDWKLPPGFTAGQIQWPLPVRATEPGGLVTYDYPGKVVLPVEIRIPSKLMGGQVALISAHAEWLVCRELCVPGKADLSITLPMVSTSHPANQEVFDHARALLPTLGTPPFSVAWSRQGQNLFLKLGRLDPATKVDFFPLPGDVQIGHPEIAGQTVRIPLLDPADKADSIGGVVVLDKQSGKESWQLPPKGNLTAPGGGNGQLSLLYWLGLGFVGGLILNVMPCVLPVIALKIFGFIKQAGESPRRILALGFTFVAGIFAWFLFLAALIVGFKMAGHQLNWAFQFQYPGFVAGMVIVLLLFSLNLLGIFEIVLPGRVQAGVQEAASQEGYAGTFFHGVFATLMATPCTAPFLGPALGFALAQPPPTVFAMFGSIAAGMSAPYAILAFKPGWLKFLPKPGMWMVRLKQGLGVLLLGTVLWLGSVLFQQLTSRPEPFPPRLAQALAQHKIVFVDFTAAWCVNCKVNEHQVINSAPVQEAFRKRGVILLKADWTNGDAAITDLLRKFGRAGVPCYVVYKADGEPIVLPEIITQDIVLDALNQA